ncbi:MAG: hypothetical protein NVSMB2_11430 [Chloroflexota bacterium]
MREGRALAIIVLVGLVTFFAMYAVLQTSRLDAAVSVQEPASEVNSPANSRDGRAAGSFAAALPAGSTLVGIPPTGLEPLLRDAQTGDRLDVVVSMTGGQGSGPLTAVAVRGATVVRAPSGNDPLLVQVPSSDAIVLAHLVLGGQRLVYVVWPANGKVPPPAPAVDVRTVRQVLGLEPTTVMPTVAPVASATAPVAATPTPVAVTTAAAVGAVTSGFIYQVQPGDTWVSLANTFGFAPQELRRWNDAPDDTPLVPGTLVIVPRRAR